jgi:hypothetical protein
MIRAWKGSGQVAGTSQKRQGIGPMGNPLPYGALDSKALSWELCSLPRN